jgi:hypothetical protein
MDKKEMEVKSMRRREKNMKKREEENEWKKWL